MRPRAGAQSQAQRDRKIARARMAQTPLARSRMSVCAIWANRVALWKEASIRYALRDRTHDCVRACVCVYVMFNGKCLHVCVCVYAIYRADKTASGLLRAT